MNKKSEAAVDLGFLKDRILFSAAWFLNRCSNQLVTYRLPIQTGFAGVIQNFPAIVQNQGWEFVLNTKNLTGKNFSWSTAFNISIPRNKLAAFPNIVSSTYANTYIVGQSLTVLQRFHSLGVDPTTGVYIFSSSQGPSSTPVSPTDAVVIGNLDPKFYGGFLNTLIYKSWQLDFFFEFKKQMGPNYKAVFSVPGTMNNQPIQVFNRWQNVGDQEATQNYSELTSRPAYKAASSYSYSDGVYSDASYILLKNISLSYRLPSDWLKRVKVANVNIYLRGQNLLTITKYLGNDPETKNVNSLPPLKTLVAGIQITL